MEQRGPLRQRRRVKGNCNNKEIYQWNDCAFSLEEIINIGIVLCLLSCKNKKQIMGQGVHLKMVSGVVKASKHRVGKPPHKL
jgi:hypothetical protein